MPCIIPIIKKKKRPTSVCLSNEAKGRDHTFLRVIFKRPTSLTKTMSLYFLCLEFFFFLVLTVLDLNKVDSDPTCLLLSYPFVSHFETKSLLKET